MLKARRLWFIVCGLLTPQRGLGGQSARVSDAELGEDAGQVHYHRAGRDEQLTLDDLVAQSLARQQTLSRHAEPVIPAARVRLGRHAGRLRLAVKTGGRVRCARPSADHIE